MDATVKTSSKKAVKKVAPKKKSKSRVHNVNVPYVANIFEKIFNVQASVEMAAKGGQHQQSYKYARETDIISAVKPHLVAQRLAITANTISHEKTDKLKTIGVTFTITNVDRPTEQVSETFYGEGEDKTGSTVGTPIAYTMALKYFLAKTFLLETGDDAELEKRKGKGQESQEAKFEKAKKMIASAGDMALLMSYADEKLPKSSFTEAQKTELRTLINARLDGTSTIQTA